jgi:cell division protein FtsB
VIKNVLFLFVVLAAVFVLYLPSYMQMQDLRHRNEVSEKRIIELEAENIKFAAERDKLKNDPEYFEKVARERMGLIKDGEVIYKVLPPGTKKTIVVEEVKPKVTVPVKKSTSTKNPATKSAPKAAKTTKTKAVVATDKKKQVSKD